jgi:GLPGLI family protein
MRNSIYIIFFFYFTAFSQNSGQIEYLFSTNFATSYNTLGILEFTNFKSQFTLLKSSVSVKEMKTSFNENHLDVVLPESNIRPINYMHLTDSIMLSQVSMLNSIYIVKENLPKINWKIEDEFKQLSNLKCQKATGYFRGRTYTVWFATNIPVPFGPWKLQGLPGLILEAKDEENKIFIKARKIVFKPIEELIFPDEATAIDLKEFISVTTPNKYQELEALANAKFGSRNTSVKLSLPYRYTSKELIYEWEEEKKDQD